MGKQTIFGYCSINPNGYYRVTSNKEGNHGRFLHNLIWENHYGKPVPEGYNIHHINGNKIDNRIQNLQCVKHEKHTSFHHKGKVTPVETRKKMSEAQSGEKCKLYRGEIDPNHIRQEALKGKLNSELAKEFDCNIKTIRRRLKQVCTLGEYEEIKANNRSKRKR